MSTPRICTVENCDREVVARGWCRRHYARWQRTGQLDARPWARQGICTVDGCEQAAWSGGFCDAHRWHVRTQGVPSPVSPRKKQERPICAVEGCERLCRYPGQVHCHLHIERIRRTGEPGPAEPLRTRGQVKPGSHGYVRLTMPDGRRVLEHVLVMEQLLGRRLVDGENVHHKNGIKHDNDPSNLELWFVMQPTGQRVQDLMAYIARYHADAMRALLAERG